MIIISKVLLDKMKIKAKPPIVFISYTFISPLFELKIMNLSENYNGKCIEKRSVFDTERHLFFSFVNLNSANTFDIKCKEMIEDEKKRSVS